MTRQTDRCRVTFKIRGLTEHVRCDLPHGHAEQYHEHSFLTWTARVWKARVGLRFRYFAKPGHSLPDHFSSPDCDGSVLPEHRALSSGALGTPDRDHACEECGGSGVALVFAGFMAATRRCVECFGSGAFKADGTAALSSDGALRNRASQARAAGKIGRQS